MFGMTLSWSSWSVLVFFVEVDAVSAFITPLGLPVIIVIISALRVTDVPTLANSRALGRHEHTTHARNWAYWQDLKSVPVRPDSHQAPNLCSS